ncbi:sugar ABC transporter ATP-binding protein [Aeromicrobium ginsengisoli]|uniref:Sugar ABC transporter ATP-binding protein n=1 Tax=Aeromicrobium ginsengisoli TaxID=363867 RepID=A0A5M4FCZ7_9ACTN|nr:sugar ABC transporter ATP-binding protein [Aeromicrobium ginsengisoli]KAA1397112.1 sugar ABC transporter ATP-binding protein [Aeromicrobium ginsengisoli]
MTPPAHAVRLKARSLRKSFGASKALQGCSLDVRAGEIHAVCGENGSGKSTLVKILSGVQRPDVGEYVIGDHPDGTIERPRDALRAGVATVFQELLMVDTVSVLDNLQLGIQPVALGDSSPAEFRRRAQSVLEELLGYCPDLDGAAEGLSLSEKQTCSIARSLLRQPDVLILDEATSALDAESRDRLFVVLNRLRSRGVGIVFISHRMDEVDELADRITVLRSGASVATLERGKFTREDLIHHMTGADQLTAGTSERQNQLDPVSTHAVMRMRGVRIRENSYPVDFTLRQGEIVGVGGLDGHGQDEFLLALWGHQFGSAGGVVVLEDELERPITSASAAVASGIGYVPRERRSQALFPALTIRENFGVRTLERDTVGPFLMWSRTHLRFEHNAKKLNIKFGQDTDLITTLSGGNQQKVILARWLASHPRVLILNDPTRGIDINAKRDLYALLVELADSGVAIVMNSTEIDELVELADRVLVFREGAVARELQREELSRTTLVESFFGMGRSR